MQCGSAMKSWKGVVHHNTKNYSTKNRLSSLIKNRQKNAQKTQVFHVPSHIEEKKSQLHQMPPKMETAAVIEGNDKADELTKTRPLQYKRYWARLAGGHK